MDIVSPSGLPVSSLLWQPRPGTWVVTVVCKATFRLSPGTCSLATEHEPLVDADQYIDGDPRRELRAASDLAPVKPRVDVLLIGHAHAPGRRPVETLEVRFAVGELRKTFEVVGDRSVGPGGARRGPLAFTTMPLRHERAAGGAGTSNPVGISRDRPGPDGWMQLPNLQRPDGSPLESAFGPLAPSWPHRRARLGPHASTFPPADLASLVVPEGLDLTFFNAAPPDQQLRSIAVDETLTLENLLLDEPLLTTRLPGFSPRAILEGVGPGPRPLAMRADTICIDADRALCTVTFRASTPVDSKPDRMRVIVSAPDAPIEAAPRSPSGPDFLDATADIPLAFRAGTALPFAGEPVASPLRPALASSAVVALDSIWARRDALVSPGAPAPSPPPPAVEEAPASLVQPAPPPQPATPALAPDPLELLWFDADAVSRLRRKAEFRRILDELEQSPADPDLDDGAASADALDVEDRRDVFELLARCARLDLAGLASSYRACIRADGKFVPVLVAVGGELETSFDEIAELEATTAIVAPFSAQDDALRSLLASAKEFLATPADARPADVAVTLTGRIEELLAKGKRISAAQLAAHRTRVLLEHRRYRTRSVFGSEHLHARLDLALGQDRNGSKVPVYLRREAGACLPLAARLRVHLLAELRPAVDPRDEAVWALRVLAVGRVIERSRTS